MNLIKIDDITCEELELFTKYNETQLLHYYEPEPGIFIAETAIVIQRALNMGCRPIAWLVEDKSLDSVTELIEEAEEKYYSCESADRNEPEETPVYTAPLEVLKQLIGFNLTRGVLCALRRPKQMDLGQLLAGKRRVAVLENVMNPTNLGAIFRSAAALGIEAVLVTKGSTDPFYRRAARVSMGTVFQVPWMIVDENWVQQVKQHGFQLVSMALSNQAVSLADPILKGREKLAIILGTESTGITEQVLDASDFIVKIPMSNGVDSLNVAAAGAVVFWELCKQEG